MFSPSQFIDCKGKKVKPAAVKSNFWCRPLLWFCISMTMISPDTGEHCQLDSCNSSLAQLEIKLELFDKQGKDLKFVQLTTEHKVFKSSNRSNGIKQTLFNPSSSFQLWGNLFQTVWICQTQINLYCNFDKDGGIQIWNSKLNFTLFIFKTLCVV